MTALPSPARALAWEFGRRHRWGWTAVGAYLAVMTAIKAWAFANGQTLTIEDDERFGLLVMFPLSATILYAITVFTFGLSGDLAGRESLFPARLFRLPMTTQALAWWPMLFGAVAMVVLWAATRSLVILPPNVEVAIPFVWPAVLGVAILGWAQAATWMPYGLRGMRVITTVLWLVAIDAVVLLAVYLKTPEWVMIALLAPQIPVAWLAARAAVARARSGEVPDWSVGRAKTAATAARRPFESAAAAQLWFEWRRHGWSLPGLVAMVVPIELLLLFTVGGSRSLTFMILAGVAITPPFLARAVGATVSRSSVPGSDPLGLPTLMATRPLPSAALVGATLKVTVASTLVTWVMVTIASVIAMMLSGTWALVTDYVSRAAATIGTPRTVALVVVLGVVLLLATWRQLVQSLCVGLTGREWLVKANVFGTMFLAFLIVPFGRWAWEKKHVLMLWDAMPATLVILAVAKTTVACVVYRALWRRRVLSDAALVGGAGLWCAAVIGLYVTFAWFWDTRLMPRATMAAIAILIVPLARISAAPLAFDWNRHR